MQKEMLVVITDLEGTKGDLVLLGGATITVHLLQSLHAFQHTPIAPLHRLHPLLDPRRAITIALCLDDNCRHPWSLPTTPPPETQNP